MKTDIEQIKDSKTRNIYNEKSSNISLKKEYGLNEELIRKLSKEKKEPDWVLDIRRLWSIVFIWSKSIKTF